MKIVKKSSCTKDHLAILDGLRGFLAFWVFFAHFELSCIGKIPPWGPGGAAVDVFMLLSGFLMAYHWHMRQERFDTFKSQVFDFYVRRFFRIAPLYYILLIAAFLGYNYYAEMSRYLNYLVPVPWAAQIQDQVYTPYVNKDIGIFNIIAHYTFVFGFIPKYISTNALPDWSIALEMQFYVIFPFLMILIGRIGPFTTAFILVVISYMTNNLIGLYSVDGPLGNFPQPSFILFKINVFMAGISLSYAYIYRNSVKCVSWIMLIVLSLAYTANHVLVVSLFILFLLNFDVEKKELINKFASSRFVKFFGDTSYSVYLVHIMIYLPILNELFKYSWFMNLNEYLRLIVGFVICAIPVYTLAYFLYRNVEIRGINIGRNILRTKKMG